MIEEHAAAAQHLRQQLEQGRKPLLARLDALEEGSGGTLVGLQMGRDHAQVLDALVRAAYRAADVPAAGQPSGAAVVLAGVGGYGRGAVCLGADLDVRILTQEPQRAEELAQRLLYPLWDAGLNLGHQVVAIEDLIAGARQDLPTATTLLDWRFIAGERPLSDDLLTRARSAIFSSSEVPRFLERLDDATVLRHKRYGDSVYLLEPDVKNGHGALRDLDVAWWAARARWNVGGFDELVRLGILVRRQLVEVEKARELLWRIRNLLHGRAGRRSDRLSFDEQEHVARLLGYVQAPGREALGAAVETLMSEYYRAARTISQFRDLIVARALPRLTRRRPPLRELGGGVQLFDGQVSLADHEEIVRDPAIAMRMMAAAVKRGAPLYPRARNLVIAACGEGAWCVRLRASEEAASLFVQLVSSRTPSKLKTGSIIGELHDLGLLLAMVPEFQPVVNRVHHDTYHVYTVDVHSVATVQRLGEIARAEVGMGDGGAWESMLACRLSSEISRPQVLFFAGLLHDIGKAIGRHDHSGRGAVVARDVLKRLGFSAIDIDDVCRLVEHHLQMYHLATRRDLEDPGTAAELKQLVKDREGLRNLYLLTVADISTTGPTSMTSWKARMLDELFLHTDAVLGEGSRHPRSRARRREEIMGASGDAPAVRYFVDGMLDRYLFATPLKSVIHHAGLLQQLRNADGTVTVGILPSRDAELAQMVVLAPDRAGLLADIAATLSASRLVVHAAEIYSHIPAEDASDVTAVDIFWIELGQGSSFDGLAEKLQRDLRALLSGQLTAEDLAVVRGGGRRRKKTPEVPPKVVVDNRASPGHTVVEVFASDKPGLLFALSKVIFEEGLNIAVAKISTEGTRVVDVFYVSDQEGNKVTVKDHCMRLQSALLSVVEGTDT